MNQHKPVILAVEFSNGVKIPLHGAGTEFANRERGILLPEEACESVTLAFDSGTHHVDTALACKP